MRLDGDDVQRAQGGARLLVCIDRDAPAFRTDREVVRVLHAVLFSVRSFHGERGKRDGVHEFADFISHARWIAQPGEIRHLENNETPRLAIPYTMISFSTVPLTSVSRKSRPA